MELILITYDLIPIGQNYTNLINKIKEIPGENMYWSKLKSTWIIRTELNSKAVFEILSQYIDDNDKLLVLTLDTEGAWKGFSEQDSKFLKDYIG